MGAVFALFAGFYYWAPKIIGLTYNEYLGKVHFWTMFAGVSQNIDIPRNELIILNNNTKLQPLPLPKPVQARGKGCPQKRFLFFVLA